MGSVLTTLACMGPQKAPELDIPRPLPDAKDFDASSDYTTVESIRQYSITQFDPRIATDKAFVQINGSLYPAQSDVTISCPGGLPAYRLSNSGYSSLTGFLKSKAKPSLDPLSDPATLIGNADVALGIPECYDRDDIIPYTHVVEGGGI